MPKPSPRAAQDRRKSPDAVAKRRAARKFNEVVLGPSPRASDGRTERKRRRLLQELTEGVTRSGQELKPIDVLVRAQELLDLGEPLASVAAARPSPPQVETTDALVDGVRTLHRAYGFAPELYRLVGIDDDALLRAGVSRERRGPVKATLRPSPASHVAPDPEPAPPHAGSRRGAA